MNKKQAFCVCAILFIAPFISYVLPLCNTNNGGAVVVGFLLVGQLIFSTLLVDNSKEN